MLLMPATTLTACGPSQLLKAVGALVANPERIKEIQRRDRWMDLGACQQRRSGRGACVGGIEGSAVVCWRWVLDNYSSS